MSSQISAPSLKSRTLFSLVLLGLVLVLGSSAWQLQQELRQRSERIADDLRALPLLYAEPLALSLAESRPERTRQLLNSMLERHSVQRVELLARNGQRLSARQEGEEDGPSSHFSVQLPGSAESLGEVQVVAAPSNWRTLLAQDHVLEAALQHLGLVLMLAFAAALLLDRLLLRHLRRMTEDLERFDPSQPPSQLSWTDSDRAPLELQQVNRAFNHVQQSVDAQLQREQARVAALNAEVARQSEQLRAAELALEAKKRELAVLSRHDGLTGLANRREFDDALRREFKRAQRQHARLALAVLDLDHLKAYNEVHGHAAGDALLKRFAQLLAERFKRDTDMVARLGGEEFAALLPGFDQASAQGLLETLREEWRALALPHGASPVDQVVTVSIGLAAYSPHQPYLSPQALMQAADEALYIAKHAGRDRLSLAA
ncbi:GGDEF domain-containing protein [Paucibacter sp. APW11]|uniref:diguanylate cyclase n=1 Tax=Roseateles aquae TaxID=3077235 RepID=A0ABU3PHI0_9BURK|nr:GGDEF domain-containing protein [Paucibacter sp. APW11]MDT9002036.1 GGDEF domain-containing protein [Paucibacter sp. APW11]